MSRDTSLLDDLDECLSGLRRVWAHPDRKRRFLAELGVAVELSVLRTLRAVELGVGDDPETVGVSDVADLLQVTPSTASRLLDQAVHLGYVVRAECEDDRRRADLRLTGDGRALLERAREVRRDLLAQVTADWSRDDIALLNRLLGRLQQDVRRLDAVPVPA